MSQVEMLAKQTQDAYHWTNKLIDSIPHNQGDNTIQVLNQT